MKSCGYKSWCVAAAYVVLHVVAHLSAQWFEVSPGISLWYVPGGLALALVTLLGPRYMPLVFAANFVTAWLPTTVAWWMVWFFPLLITLGYGAAGVLVRRHLGGKLLPGTPRETLGFVLVAGLAPLVVAVIGTAVYYVKSSLGQAPFGADFWPSVMSWWIGDTSGILTVVPVIMVFVAPWLAGEKPAVDLRRMNARTITAAVARALVLMGTIAIVVGLPVLRDHDAFYICFLPLIWICVHHGLPGATLATLLIMMVGLVSMRMAETTVGFAHVFLLFELAVSSVGLGLGTMVTRRNEAERKLAAAGAKMDRVISGAQLGLWDLNLVTGAVEINERYADMIGYEAAELFPFRERWPEFIHAEDRLRVENAMMTHLEGRSELFEVEFRLRKKDGHWCWLHSRGSIVKRSASGMPLQVSGTQVDITARRRVQAEVGRLLRIIEATPDLIVTADAQGRVIYMNEALLKVCGQCDREGAGKNLRDLLAGEAATRLLGEAFPAALAAGSWHGEATIVDAAGRSIPTSQVVLAHRDEEDDSFSFSVVMRDLSDQRRAETERRQRDRELLQLQKAESLGVMAGGIAHDFNNLLTSVMGHANLATVELPPGAPALMHLAKIEQAATCAAALCQQMLAYAGRNPVSFSEIDLNQLVDEASGLLGPNIGGKVDVRLDLAKPLSPILAAGTQMQQVVMNLVLNAAEAIGTGNEGRVTVRTGDFELSEAELGRQFPGHMAAAGAYVVLEVEDTGCGMSVETRARIFEPFFTTKFTGQGLGLAAVAGVVKSHRGAIAVRSSPGAGTIFRVAFPSLAKKSAPVIIRYEALPDTWKGTGTILVVDDDHIISEVTAHILRSFGFATLTAGDGREAVEVFGQHSAHLAGVLLDLTMPVMDGFAAHAEMHRINPSVPVILMSGFSEKLEHLPPEAIHPAGVLAKPFNRKQLRERIASVIPQGG
ncbi:hybrid sensor histidine kinase/response regulator [Rariglobus hedericola]|uniref:histidine kinase n=1 Tax=Rariglobus hedericola TaxID=2597822 RepID=A0A556QKN2_9BACT|nr:PAS domain-containing protein [Rariglobus hedericola]TSJ77162.1 PAS domain S-box protein [Rariglobus hedericola]